MCARSIRVLLCASLLGASGALRADIASTPASVLDGLACPYRIEVGDLNDDGRNDLAVASWHRLPVKGEKYDHERDRVLLFFQRADGTFASPPDREIPAKAPWGMCAGDFDGDGKTDLAIKETRRTLHLLLGAEGLKTLHSSVNINDSDRHVRVGRLSPGGVADFLCGPAWRKWRGGDTFSVGYCYGPEQTDNHGGVIADLNLAGQNDMVFLASGQVRVYHGPFTTMTVRPRDLSALLDLHPPMPAQDVEVADLTGDGRPDLLVAMADRAAGKRGIALYRQQAPLGFPENPTPTTLLEDVTGSFEIADLNGDELLDLTVADAARRQVHVFIQAQGVTLRSTVGDAYQTLKVSCHDVKAADINGDGFPDLAVSDGRKAVRFFLNDGQFELGRSATSAVAQVVVAATADKTAAAPRRESPAQSAAAIEAGNNETAELLAGLPPAAPGVDHGDPLRMPFYTGTILPTPQQVSYRDEYMPLANTSLRLGKGIAPDSALVRELRERIERYGGSLKVTDSVPADAGTVILLGDVAEAAPFRGGREVPEREQGYLMICTTDGARNVVVLQGHDHLGLLWAIASFNQLVHVRDGETVLRAADVVDYPASANRGFISGNWVDSGRYCIAFKINKPVFQTALMERSRRSRKERYEAWREPLSAEIKADLAACAERFTPHGIQWYAGHNPIAAENKIRSGNDADFQVVLDWACTVEGFGGHLCLKYDDHRFPISPDDMQQFGSAREADTHLLLRLHSELKQRYPNARILFCPPFYWGPNSPALYPEPRHDYLVALGQRLPQDIEIFWTGPSVKSGRVTPDMVDWITERLQRRPVYWQNGFAMPHMFLYHYVTDPIPILKEWFYDGFLQHVDAYMFNSMMPGYAAAAAACGDYCWNPGAHDPERSIKDAATKLVGPDTYPALVALTQSLCYFDKFGLRRTPGAAQQLPVMTAKLATVNAVWKEIEENRNIAAVDKWTSMRRHVDQVNGFHDRLKRSPDLAAYRQDAGESLQHAAAETGFTEGAGTFLSAYDFTGGYGPSHYANRCEKRLATWIYASRSANPKMEASFRVEPFPPATDYELVVCAQDDDADAKCDVRITVNDTTVFEGENPHVRFGWDVHTFRLPAAALQRQSRLLIENIEPGGRAGGPPFFMLNYAVVRKAAQ